MNRWQQFWSWMSRSSVHQVRTSIAEHETFSAFDGPEAEPLDVMPPLAERDPRMMRVPTGEISWETGPLSALQDRRVLAVFDCENLSISAKENSLRLSYGRLMLSLRSEAASCEAHAFFSRMAGDERQNRYLQRSGLITHPRDIEFVESRDGTRKLANSDSRMLFMTGVLLAHSDANTLLIGSGDGDLGNELARGVRALGRPLTVLTLSLAGHSSRRLDAATNDDIHGNLEVGLDVMRPLETSSRWMPKKRRQTSNAAPTVIPVGARRPDSPAGNPPRKRPQRNARPAIIPLTRDPEPRLLPMTRIDATRPVAKRPIEPMAQSVRDEDILFPEPATLSATRVRPTTSGPLTQFLNGSRSSIRPRGLV